MSPVTSVTFILAKPGLSPPDRQLPDQQPTADRNSCDLTYLYIYILYIYYVLFWRSCITYKFTVLPWHHIINMINVPKEQNIDVFEGLAVPPGSIPCLQFGTSGEASTNSKGCPAGVPMAILTIPPFRSCAIYFHYCVQKEIVNSWQWYA